MIRSLLQRFKGLSTTALNDPSRVQAIRERGYLNKNDDEAFDRIAQIATRLLSAPIALVSIVEPDRQFFKCALGLPEPWCQWRETPLSHSFCQHVVTSGEPLVVSDARNDPNLRDNLAIRDLNVIAYVGFPLFVNGPERLVVGSFCVIDHEPREWTAKEISDVKRLTDVVIADLEMRRLLEYSEGILSKLSAAPLPGNAPMPEPRAAHGRAFGQPAMG